HTRFSRDWSSDVCSSDLATDGEGRDEDVTAACAGFGEDFRHLCPGGFPGTVLAVTVGALEDHQIRRVDEFRVAQHGCAAVAKVRSAERRVGEEGRARGEA